MLQAAFQLLLMFVLAAAVVSFAAMGLVQHRHGRSLSRYAHERSVRFSREDPLGLVHRYAELALLSAGHSLMAENVTHGRADGRPFRACELGYEVAHGTQRSIRRYSVFWVEFPRRLPSVLMWNDQDADRTPASVHLCDAHKGCWSSLGDEEFSSLLASLCEPLAVRGVSMQSCGSTLMLCFPQERWRGTGYFRYLDAVLDVASGVSRAVGGSAIDGDPEQGKCLGPNVENPAAEW